MGTKNRWAELPGSFARWAVKKFPTILALLLCLVAGYWFGGNVAPDTSETPSDNAAVEEKAEVWTCSMHPQVQLPEPGLCPICNMDLIPLLEDDAGGLAGSRTFTTSEAAKGLMNIQVSEVVRRFVEKEVLMVGKIDFDETKLAYITAWVPGRIDRLYVDYTGVNVRKGDHLVYLYSPELLTAQDELRRAAQAAKKMGPNAPDILKQTTRSTVIAAREKLRRWGLTDSQINAAETANKTSDHITIYAPIGGTVIHRDGQEGMYVDTGTRIYTIADMNTLWVMLDAYESHLPWIHYGQTVSFTTESYPGEVFEGKIAFIDPVLDKTTRTVKVRVNVANPDGKLKPEMFVRAMVKSQVATGGRVMDPGISGKWISPMHPEIIKDEPGQCDVCGMDLVKAEDLGYVSVETSEADMPLVIPASAPLITGARAIVYVEVPDTEKPTFEGHEIVLGPRAGDFYIVKSGLQAGEHVVTNGNFKIDSALQILAKPSMMSPDGGGGAGHDHGGGSGTKSDAAQEKEDAPSFSTQTPEAFQQQLGKVYEGYLILQTALAGDTLDKAREGLRQTKAALEKVDRTLVEGDAHGLWMKLSADLENALDASEKADSIESIRKALSPLSETLWSAVKSFGVLSEQPVYQAHCPMAFDFQGANWLQSTMEIRNPYFGASMLACGEIVEKLGPADQASKDEAAHSEGSDHK